MAEEEDSTRKNSSSSSGNTKEAHHQDGNVNGNGNDDDDDDASGWLRLGIGCSAPHHNQTHNQNSKHSDQPGPRGSMQLELNLLPAGSRTTPSSSLLFQQQQSSVTRATAFLPPPPLFYYQPPQPQQQQQIMSGWANNNSSNYYRMMTPVIPNYAINPTTSVMVVGSPSTTQPAPAAPSFLLQPRPMTTTTSFQLPQSSADHIIRLIDPPRRPHSGIWFLLQPSLHQSKQPFLPQLPKNYLRIKDGRMTVRFLIKYLVNKLGLESESEVEIRCRGQQLEASLTMQHVRDEIWSTSTNYAREAAAASSAAHHLMLLHYARSS